MTRERCRTLKHRRQSMENLLNWAFPAGSEKRKFIEAYWLTYAGGEVQIRAGIVFSALPFLGECSNSGIMRGNRNFYYWRDKIYEELGRVLGYLPENPE